MQSNAMKKCAVGAMLFGGTLGLSQAASAGVVNFLPTAPGTGPNQAYSGIVINGLSGTNTNVYNSLASSVTWSNATTSVTASVTGTTPVNFTTGIAFKGSRSGTNVSQNVSMQLYRVFTVTGGSANWEGSLRNNNAGNASNLRYFEIYSVDPVTGQSVADPSTGLPVGPGTMSFQGTMTGNAVENFSGTLAEGTYLLFVQSHIGPTATSDATFATFNIPAPGALALLGAAGMIARRRKA
jgi:hypothetical protein